MSLFFKPPANDKTVGINPNIKEMTGEDLRAFTDQLLYDNAALLDDLNQTRHALTAARIAMESIPLGFKTAKIRQWFQDFVDPQEDPDPGS